MRFTGFIGPSYLASSLNVDCQRCMNLYPEVDPLGTGKDGEVSSLVSTPGLTPLLTLPDSPIRGMWTTSTGKLYVVAGQHLYYVASDWSYTQLGLLNSSSGSVSMSDNGIQLVIVDGTNGYYVTLSNNGFFNITSPSFLGSAQVAFLDNYFVFIKPNSQEFFCSDAGAITFDPLNIGTAEGSPDNLVGLTTAHLNIYFFGSQSTEVFYDSGDTPCPFTRIQGAVVNVGCSAPFSIQQIQNLVYWVGGDKDGQGIVYRMNGYQPERISTPSIEALLRGVGSTNLAGATSWSYQQGGHVFYCLNVPGLSTTWVFDTSTSMWHERTYLGSWGFERHRVQFACVAYGYNVVGDYATGGIYLLDPSNYTDNGVSIVRLRASPHISKDMKYIFHSKFQLDLETGVGLSGTGQGIDPVAMLDWSDDGGHNWSSEKTVGIGKIGKTKERAIWKRLGRARDRVYRVKISDPVKVVLIGADIEMREGSA